MMKIAIYGPISPFHSPSIPTYLIHFLSHFHSLFAAFLSFQRYLAPKYEKLRIQQLATVPGLFGRFIGLFFSTSAQFSKSQRWLLQRFILLCTQRLTLRDAVFPISEHVYFPENKILCSSCKMHVW